MYMVFGMCSIQLFNDEEMNTTSTDKVFEYTVRVYHDGKFI